MSERRVALAYSGSPAGCAAIRWWSDVHAAAVIAVIVDVGQTDDLQELSARALTCGAVRAHVIDRRDVFARHALVSAIAAASPLNDDAMRRLAHPVLASAVAEVCAVEAIESVVCVDEGSLEPHICALAPQLRVVAAGEEWRRGGLDVTAYATAQRLPRNKVRTERHLLIRCVPPNAGDGPARITIAFDAGQPVAVNEVAMTPAELVECVSLIAGQYGIGVEAEGAPAAAALRAAYAASGGEGSVTLHLQPGAMNVVTTNSDQPELVHHS